MWAVRWRAPAMSMAPLLLTASLLLAVPAAAAGGPSAAVLITTGAVIQSAATGDSIHVPPGSWLRFRMGQIVADSEVAFLDAITIEIELDGESLAVERVVEDFGVLCVPGNEPPYADECHDATALWGFGVSPPLKRGIHTLTYRQVATAPGQDGFGGLWEAGLILEATGTLAVDR